MSKKTCIYAVILNNNVKIFFHYRQLKNHPSSEKRAIIKKGTLLPYLVRESGRRGHY